LLDLGCGRGTFLRQHGSDFESCVGVDFSGEMLRLAATQCRRLPNVSFVRSDARRFRLPSPPPATLTACFNGATSPLVSHRRRIWNTVASCTADDGHALLVVPSFESASALQMAAATRRIRVARRLLPGGIASIDGVRQRFFRADELVRELKPHGLSCVALLKVWYPWGEEGLDGRQLRGVEPPWDWLAVARRLPRRHRHGRTSRK
jgi:SAM-dependent methyltransferase